MVSIILHYLIIFRMMKKLCYKLILLILTVISLNSCRKNELESIELTKNIHEGEFEMMVPVRITSSYGFVPTPGNCRVILKWEIIPDYVTLMQNRTYQLVIYKNGIFEGTRLSTDIEFIDAVICGQSNTYTMSVRYTDNQFETLQSESNSIQVN